MMSTQIETESRVARSLQEMVSHPELVLSLFPGIGLLDMAFELEGFCVVRGPDLLWGGDVRNFHVPAGKFDGVIGGPPCQKFSSAAVAVGGTKAANLIPEFERIVAEANPRWFIMENVRQAPLPNVPGFLVHAQLVNNRHFGEAQNRVRRISFGSGLGKRLLLETATFYHPVWKRAVLASDGKRGGAGSTFPSRRGKLGCEKFTLRQACILQGVSPERFEALPFTKEHAYRVVGNGVPLPMGRAIAKAVRMANDKR
jgi:DNA (cytosine-5)-methyltransferase 1